MLAQRPLFAPWERRRAPFDTLGRMRAAARDLMRRPA
jgi:hypothetical protein